MPYRYECSFEQLNAFEKWILLNFYSDYNFLKFYNKFVYDTFTIKRYRDKTATNDILAFFFLKNEKSFLDFFLNEYKPVFPFPVEYACTKKLKNLKKVVTLFLLYFFPKIDFTTLKNINCKFLKFIIFRIYYIKHGMFEYFKQNFDYLMPDVCFFYFLSSLTEIEKSFRVKKKKTMKLNSTFEDINYYSELLNTRTKWTWRSERKFASEWIKARGLLKESIYKFHKKTRHNFKNLFENSKWFTSPSHGGPFLSSYIIKIKPYIHVFENYEKQLMKFNPIKYSESSVNKFINLQNSNKIYFLRKNKIFNKGRYSRNRQLYRTGVYWCLWFNIIFVYGLFYFFYRFAFNFGQLWWGVCIFLFCFIIGKVLKYRFYNFKILLKEVYSFIGWLSLVFKLNFFIKFFKNIGIILKHVLS